MSKIKSQKKTTPERNTTSPVRYDINIGAKVKDILRLKGITYQEFADTLKITKNGFANRLLKPHYGTIYDVIETSIELDTDLLSDSLAYLKKRGITVDNLSASAENTLLKEEIIKLNEELERYRKIVDKFTR